MLGRSGADKVGVSKVEFDESSTLLSTATTSPYSSRVNFASTNNGACLHGQRHSTRPRIAPPAARPPT
ncbi:Ig-like domain-containing protein [Deinococcus frigens]|uniref:Ig-like domain-containing protein n=1 Tax=Deinococcus frigens TaxID=249403 RepID=UPI003CCBF2F7